jgi:hypothetical protein
MFFLTYLTNVRSQDLIVTEKGDSLNCKITQIKSKYIYFTFKYENEIRNTLLPLGQIKYYKKKFYSKSEVPIDKLKNVNADYQKLRIGFFGGWSYMTGKISDKNPPFMQEYLKELKSGFHIGGDVTYFTSKNIGFGLKYSMLNTANQLDNINVVDTLTGRVRTGKLKDDITIQYFGPTICTRISSLNRKTHFISNISFGYKNNATVVDNFTLTSGTFGAIWDLGVDFSIDKNLLLGMFFAYQTGTLNQYNYDDGKQSKIIKLDKDNLENISRIDLSVVLRWSK